MTSETRQWVAKMAMKHIALTCAERKSLHRAFGKVADSHTGATKGDVLFSFVDGDRQNFGNALLAAMFQQLRGGAIARDVLRKAIASLRSSEKYTNAFFAATRRMGLSFEQVRELERAFTEFDPESRDKSRIEILPGCPFPRFPSVAQLDVLAASCQKNQIKLEVGALGEFVAHKDYRAEFAKLASLVLGLPMYRERMKWPAGEDVLVFCFHGDGGSDAKSSFVVATLRIVNCVELANLPQCVDVLLQSNSTESSELLARELSRLDKAIE